MRSVFSCHTAELYVLTWQTFSCRSGGAESVYSLLKRKMLHVWPSSAKFSHSAFGPLLQLSAYWLYAGEVGQTLITPTVYGC